MFMGDWMKDYQTQIPDLLASGIRVLIYAGDQDFICNVRPPRSPPSASRAHPRPTLTALHESFPGHPPPPFPCRPILQSRCGTMRPARALPTSLGCIRCAQWLGNQAWTRAMEWPGKAAFNQAKLVPWTAGNMVVEDAAPAGELWSAANFSFLRVYAAGHMVPLDQPKASLAMLNAFTSGKI